MPKCQTERKATGLDIRIWKSLVSNISWVLAAAPRRNLHLFTGRERQRLPDWTLSFNLEVQPLGHVVKANSPAAMGSHLRLLCHWNFPSSKLHRWVDGKHIHSTHAVPSSVTLLLSFHRTLKISGMSSPWPSSYFSVSNGCICVGILTGWNFREKSLHEKMFKKIKRYRWHLGWNFTILCQVGWPDNETAKLHADMGSLSTSGESLLRLLASLRHSGWGVVGIRSQGPTYLRTERLFLQSWFPAGWYQGYSLCKVISHITLVLQSGLWWSVLNFKKKYNSQQTQKDDTLTWSIRPLQFSHCGWVFYILCLLLFYVPDIFFSWQLSLPFNPSPCLEALCLLEASFSPGCHNNAPGPSRLYIEPAA